MATTPGRSEADFCTLPPEPRRERIAWLREEVLPHARGSEPLAPGPGRAWIFAHTPERKAQLEHLVALESESCRGPVTFHLEEDVERGAEQDAGRGALRLVVRGIDPLELATPR